MFRRLLCIAAVLGLAGPARANVPDLAQCTVAIAPGAIGASLFVTPEGRGAPFTAARAPGGALVDATITLTINDSFGDPIPNYPREDIWLVGLGGGLAFVAGGTQTDSDTDENGQTRWILPLRAGGCEQDGLLVMVSGQALPAVLPLKVNSTDMNGDLVVDSLDLALFNHHYCGGAYHFCADFNHDGVVNLLDLAIFFTNSTVEPGYYYEPCKYRLGVFFADDYLAWHPGIEQAPRLDYDGPFDLYVVAISCPEAILGYEARVELDPILAPMAVSLPAGGLNYGDAGEHLVSYGIPQIPTGETEAVLLSTISVFPLASEASTVIRILPATCSSTNGEGPALIVGDGMRRANYVRSYYSGCPHPLWPGVFPAYVATTYQGATGVEDPAAPLPAAPAIRAVAPNPFNPQTTVHYDLPRGGVLNLAVHDDRGRLVRALWTGRQEAGRHQVVWDGRDGSGRPAPSGVYVIRLETAAGETSSAKVTVLK